MNSVCQFVFSRNILTVEELSMSRPLNVAFRCQGRPKPSWASHFFYWLSRTATYKSVFQGLRESLELQGSVFHSHLLSKTIHGGSSNRSTYFEDLGEDEPEASVRRNRVEGQWKLEDSGRPRMRHLSGGHGGWIGRNCSSCGWNRWSRVRKQVLFCVGWW